MSRLNDAQRLLVGLGRLGAAHCRVTQSEIEQLWNSSYVKPVVQQAVQMLVDVQKNGTGDRKTGISYKQAVDNLPLVLEGLQLYAGAVVGLPSSSVKKGVEIESINEKVNHEHIDKKFKCVEINRDISALELLDVDLTNEELLRNKIFKEIHESEEISKENTDELKSFIVSDGNNIRGRSGDPLKISSSAKERRVPATRLSRVANFASLGVGLGLGIVAEASKRAVGMGNNKNSGGASLDGSLILNEANAERIVATLCRVRGAALKMGQILSIQDGAVIGPELQTIFDRVRESADFMPLWQLEDVMKAELGDSWRRSFDEFSNQPFAAASIGQVHHAVLHDGRQVAVKVQYPGVAKSIDSDIRNLMSLISVMALLPEGLFIDSLTKHMKIELAQECDYVREAECGTKMRSLLSPYSEYYVPLVEDDLSTGQILTSEYITGLTIDHCVELDQITRNFIAESILKLVFRELFLNRYMQTDPNWANFLYNPDTKKIGLLDFGATREYRPEFVNTYFKIIDCAAHQDRDGVLKHSREIGFLTGYETKVMNEAHIDSVMLLAVPFHHNKPYNFGNQTITRDIQELSGVMLKERLCPPPPEVYSLHRKLSGLFLLAGKLNSQFNCYDIWQDIRNKFTPFSLESESVS